MIYACFYREGKAHPHLFTLEGCNRNSNKILLRSNLTKKLAQKIFFKMPGPIPIETCNKIVELHGRGLAPTAIARELDLSLNCVKRWVCRYRTTGRVAPAPIPGRPRITTTTEDERIKAASSQNPLWPVRRVRWLECMRASIQTIWRRMKGVPRLTSLRRKDLQLTKPRFAVSA